MSSGWQKRTGGTAHTVKKPWTLEESHHLQQSQPGCSKPVLVVRTDSCAKLVPFCSHHLPVRHSLECSSRVFCCARVTLNCHAFGVRIHKECPWILDLPKALRHQTLLGFTSSSLPSVVLQRCRCLVLTACFASCVNVPVCLLAHYFCSYQRKWRCTSPTSPRVYIVFVAVTMLANFVRSLKARTACTFCRMSTQSMSHNGGPKPFSPRPLKS